MPVQVKGEVLSCKPIGDYYSMTVVASGIAENAKPGQFVAVAVGGPDGGTMLRRAFSIYSVRETGVYGGTVEFIFLGDRQGHAPGCPAAAFVRPDRHRRPARRGRSRCRGAGQLRARRRRLRVGAAVHAGRLRCATRGCRIDAVLGASTGDRMFGALDAKRMAASVAFTTDDGSYGEKGRVSDVLPR